MNKFLFEKRFNRRIFILMISLLSLAFCFKGAVKIFEMQLGYATVAGSSMNKTIEDKAKLLVTYDKSVIIKRGDIVGILVYDENDNSMIITKRIIALPHETIKIVGNDVYIDGEILDEPYAYYSSNSSENLEIVLNENEYFAMGDNRLKSTDSRSIGPIPRDAIVTKTLKYRN